MAERTQKIQKYKTDAVNQLKGIIFLLVILLNCLQIMFPPSPFEAPRQGAALCHADEDHDCSRYQSALCPKRCCYQAGKDTAGSGGC
ncbi:hypothetical protein ES703_91817 [subsurface metagenome]